jgi:hypothetical protein
MLHRFRTSTPSAPHRIEIFVDKIEQLFNSMDPSPFHERDLDDDAEEFIVSWAQEFPRRDPISLVVHVNQLPAHGDRPEIGRNGGASLFRLSGEVESLRVPPSAQAGTN